MIRPEIEESVAAVAAKVTVGGGMFMAFWGYMESNLLGFVGLAVTILTFVVSSYYKRRDNERARAADIRSADLHAAQMRERKLREQILIRIQERNDILARSGALPLEVPGFGESEPAKLTERDRE